MTTQPELALTLSLNLLILLTFMVALGLEYRRLLVRNRTLRDELTRIALGEEEPQGVAERALRIWPEDPGGDTFATPTSTR